MLISADLFVCGLVTLIQAMGCHAVVRHQAARDDGRDLCRRRPHGVHGAKHRRPRRRRADLWLGHRRTGWSPSSSRRVISRLLRFFPPVVTGTIIAVIGIGLMRVGINWNLRQPRGPHCPSGAQPRAPEVAVRGAGHGGRPGHLAAARTQGLCRGAHHPQPQVRGPDRGRHLCRRAAYHLAGGALWQGLPGRIFRCSWGFWSVASSPLPWV